MARTILKYEIQERDGTNWQSLSSRQDRDAAIAEAQRRASLSRGLRRRDQYLRYATRLFFRGRSAILDRCCPDVTECAATALATAGEAARTVNGQNTGDLGVHHRCGAYRDLGCRLHVRHQHLQIGRASAPPSRRFMDGLLPLLPCVRVVTALVPGIRQTEINFPVYSEKHAPY